MNDETRALLPCPFCGEALRVSGGVNPYGQCETESCWMHERRMAVPTDEVRQVAAWNTRAQPKPEAGEREAIARAELVMPNGERLQCEYPKSADWAKSWSIRYPDTGAVGTTGEQDWEIVERYGLTAIADAILALPSAREQRMREALEPFARGASAYESFDGQHDFDEDYVVAECGFQKITVGHLRNARHALAMTALSDQPGDVG